MIRVMVEHENAMIKKNVIISMRVHPDQLITHFFEKIARKKNHAEGHDERASFYNTINFSFRLNRVYRL